MSRWGRIRTVTAALCLGALFTANLSEAGPGYAFAAQTEEAAEAGIRIETAEDLIDFSNKSVDETFSAGKLIQLTADIDLSGTDFRPIALLSGTFDGNGHTIKGLFISGRDSNTGLFRRITAGGLVENLTLEAEIKPFGIMENVGGIAGRNEGTIRNCTFRGTILGKESIGGIAGRNLETGTIEDCLNEAEIHGTRRTGGVTGFNEGSVLSSNNSGSVNASKKTAYDLDDERYGSSGETGIEKETTADKLNPDSIDILAGDLENIFDEEKRVLYSGGIAGVNSGLVEGCGNSGNVGYVHSGYKTGGIVGYERGILVRCSNSGPVRGRKDVGGIAGQFEPYTENSYVNDALDDARKEIDRLVELTVELNNVTQGEDDATQGNIDNIRGTADALRDTIDEQKDYYRGKDDAVEAELRGYTGDLRKKIDALDVGIEDGKAKKAVKALRNDIDETEKLMGAAEKAAGSGVTIDMSNYLGKFLKVNDDILTQVDTLLGFSLNASGDLGDFGDQLKSVRESSGRLDDYLRNIFDSYKLDIRQTDDSITVHTDRLAEQMDALNEGLKGTDSKIRGEFDKLTASIQMVNKTLNESFDEIDAELGKIQDTDDIDEIFDDVSDSDSEKPEKGSLISCENRGAVESDFNGGGIVGAANVDADVQSDFEVVSSGQISLRYSRTQKATIINCENHGSVTVKNDCAGGIAGRMDLGAVIRCKNFGRIVTEEGDYTGGIAGRSSFVIRDSDSMSTLSGNNYIGGITGFGTRVLDNRTMTLVDNPFGEKVGSIAGDLDEENEDMEARGNYFVEDGPGAIDGLTLVSQASSMNYWDFLKLPGLSEAYSAMKVVFMANGAFVKEIDVPYGSTLQKQDIPEVPGPEGGYWEDVDLSDIRQNVVVNASYTTHSSTIASDEETPVMLIQGDFYQGAALQYEREDAPKVELPKGYSGAIGYRIKLGQSFSDDTGDHRVHLLDDDYKQGDSAAVLENGVLKPVETVRDGRYVVFNLPAGMDSFYLMREDIKSELHWAFIAGGGALLLLIVLLLILRARKKRKDPGGHSETGSGESPEAGSGNSAELRAGQGPEARTVENPELRPGQGPEARAVENSELRPGQGPEARTVENSELRPGQGPEARTVEISETEPGESPEAGQTGEGKHEVPIKGENPNSGSATIGAHNKESVKTDSSNAGNSSSQTDGDLDPQRKRTGEKNWAGRKKSGRRSGRNDRG
ncbi:MAG: hypothetical protein K5989_09430 [Lachnospiraceae bacterium]|nr:hypothetical protein [Lachnospiraceae bacterium]